MYIPAPIQNKISDTEIRETLRINEDVFNKVAAQFGGTVDFVSQHIMLRRAVKSGIFHQRVRNDISSGLAIEWIKAHIDGKNLLDTISDVAKLLVMHRQPDKKSDMMNFIYNINKYYFRGMYHTFDYHLRNAVEPRGKFVSAFPWNDIQRGFKPGHYHIIVFGQCAMAAYMNCQRKLHFYDPGFGETMGVSLGFVPTYIRSLGHAAVRRANPTLELKKRFELLCETMSETSIVVLSYVSLSKKKEAFV